MSAAISATTALVIGGTALAGAAATAYAGHEAAGATRDATNAAVNEQQSALQQQATLSAPYRQLGESAIPTLQGLLGIGVPSNAAPSVPGQPGIDPSSGMRIGPGGMISQAVAGATGGLGGSGIPGQAAPFGGDTREQFLQNTPGYQFSLNQGLDATKNAAAASGMLLSGNTLEGLDRFGTGLADQTYQQQIGNYENLVGIGQAAAAGQAANIGNAANNISGALINQGNTLAGIDVNTVAGLSKVLGNAGNQFVTAQTLQNLNSLNNPTMWDTENPNNFVDFTSSDRRLKTDIERIGALDSGIPVYRYRYVGEPDRVHLGVMADEVEKVIPQAVITDEAGYQRVHYGSLR